MDLKRALIEAESTRDVLDEMMSYMNECTDKTISKQFVGEFLREIENSVDLLREYVDELKE